MDSINPNDRSIGVMDWSAITQWSLVRVPSSLLDVYPTFNFRVP